MQTNFHQSKLLTKTDLEKLSIPNNQPAVSRFITMLLLFVLASIAVVQTWDAAWPYFILAHIVYGLMSCSFFAALHETAHGTAFASKQLNQIASRIAAFLHIYPSTIFRAFHFTHHKYTHIPGKDPEISLGNKPAPNILGNWGMYLSWLSGLPLLLFKINMMIIGVLGTPEPVRKALLPFVKPSSRWSIFVECLSMVLGYAAIIYVALWHDPRWWGLLTGQVVGHLFLAAYVSMEHNGLEHNGNILDKTRSIQTNAFVRWLMWNMPYHAEHHAYPAVPFHALPNLSEALEEELVHKDKNHWDFHKEQVANLMNKT